MNRTKTIAVAATAIAAVTGATLAVVPAFAHSKAPADGPTAHGSAAARSATGGRGDLFVASLNGANEVPVQGGPAVGDRDGAALEFVKVDGDRISVAVKWRGTGRPTALHIHQGDKGANGGIKVDFTKLLGKGEHRSVTGTVKVGDKALLEAFRAGPDGFYANLHTAEFPGGAVRGQFHKVTSSFAFGRALHNFQAPVVKGRQIYECRKGENGTYSFQQRDVRAVLAGNIAHSFVAPNSGTPQWAAKDGSAVTGKVITRTPNGERNIPELDLKATPSGEKHGLFADTVEILRLNTVGGAAPSGSCQEGSIVGVPYGADYVFVQR
ncbi:CHRD domain-containing protein [Streptomyces sp. NPDC057445]|uniref:CHRD domain-containing protein n=1 Tax=Streptomyces sp. NPDC057445 TaxID=3346136 RepID=UPI00369C0BC0